MEKTENQDGSVTWRQGSREVTVVQEDGELLNQAVYDGMPCYCVHLVGDTDLYFATNRSRILHRKAAEQGEYIWYQPKDPDFPTYAGRVIQLGMWGK